MREADVKRTVDAVWMIESARLIAGIARIVRDVGVAEDLAHDALVAALEQWAKTGVPENPAAWLMATAKHRAIDRLRRAKRLADKRATLEAESAIALEASEAVIDASLDDDIGDAMLRLVFVACHPVLSIDARVALTLRLVGGLTTDEIARAFLAPEATIAQRIVRAKRALAEARVPFEAPHGEEIARRLPAVLEVIYLIFNEGYAATAGDELLRLELCQDALRLGRVVAELVPGEPEAHGLVALMEIQASRFKARVGPDGEPVLLLDQDRSRWDRLLMRRGSAALERAQRLGSTPGPYVLQASIAACHARAWTASETDWGSIVRLYDALARIAPSPVIELNRAVAVGMASGPQAALEIVDALAGERTLATYHLLPSVRGDLLAKLGRHAEARSEFARAASLTRNKRERDLLLRRAADAARDSVDASRVTRSTTA